MINIVIPMAGLGSRFSTAGYLDPKPLIPVWDMPMIKLVIQNLRPSTAHRFIFICQRAHVKAYDLETKLSQWSPGCSLIQLDGVTEGAACTVLTAESLIDNDSALMIANSDQYIDTDINHYLQQLDIHQLDGLIMTMKANDPKWSFVGLNENNLVTKVVEKEVISDEATVGLYNFRRGKDFVRAAKHMIQNNQRVNNEFYVAPTYNAYIDQGARIGIWNIGTETNGMYGLGTPADLELFLSLPISQRVSRVQQ